MAGTQVVVPGTIDFDNLAAVAPAILPPPSLAGLGLDLTSRWFLSVLAVGAGIAGYRAAGARKRREEEEAAQQAATAQLFHQLDDGDMLGEGTDDRLQGTGYGRLDADHDCMVADETIDELCEALFQGVGQAFQPDVRVGGAQPACAVPASVRATGWSAAQDCRSWDADRSVSAAVLTMRPAGRAAAVATVPAACPATQRRTRDARSIPRSRNPVGIAWLAACLLFAGWLGFGVAREASPGNTRQVAVQASAVAATAVRPAPRTRNIEDTRVGERVLAGNPTDERDLSLGVDDPDPSTWRKLMLRAPKADGSWSHIELLRPVSWLEEHGAEVGGHIWITVPECGIDSNAELLDVQPCPPIAKGAGRVVTGTFAHASAAVVDLYVEGVDQPIGTTSNHRFWCENRGDFVAAGKLRVGDELRSTGGTSRLLAIDPRARSQRVYNLEVQCEHVYRVSGDGLLVHNAGACGPGGSPAVVVSKWGAPGLQPGNWVMKGGVNPWNYVMSGKWQPGFTNKFAPYSSGAQYTVPKSTLSWPSGPLGVPKGFLGQKIYNGPAIPLAIP